MIRVENLKKNYGNKEVLKGLDFFIETGEIFSLLGPNGAGKTTTIKILTGQLDPDAGSVQIMEKDVFSHRKFLCPRLGFMPEETNLYERLSVRENLKFFCRLYGVDFNRIEKYLSFVGMAAEADTPVKKLSRGMKQKVLLIRSLLHEPEVLFLDEPVSGLDPASAASIHRLLERLNNKGLTILLTSHDMEEVDRLSDRIAFLDEGEIAALDHPTSLKLNHSPGKLEVLLKVEGKIEKRTLEINSEKAADKIAGWMKEGRLGAVHSSEPTLAEIFVDITGSELK
ncbi:ABC transporter ATP-binding protein [Halarsenatibacter silvermanii]|uniref:ABC-2 type transport system ATP-binding protein n=1 Tax=Halarsenatibacter silvermanii TaxID=321763 RepID=A0A1G9LV68_9FIRM|nr:ABC transporter ATP-binding protein [Halarsenatibacter silvermanii]SDL65793.1 ABC-2 type transport system ATP-binding protein [Halarsenatibacter silvermanii]